MKRLSRLAIVMGTVAAGLAGVAHAGIINVYLVPQDSTLLVGQQTLVTVYADLVSNPDPFTVTFWGGDLLNDTPAIGTVSGIQVDELLWTVVPSPDGDDLAGFNPAGYSSPLSSLALFSFTFTASAEGEATLRFFQTPFDNAELFSGSSGCPGEAISSPGHITVVPAVGTTAVLLTGLGMVGRRKR